MIPPDLPRAFANFSSAFTGNSFTTSAPLSLSAPSSMSAWLKPSGWLKPRTTDMPVASPPRGRVGTWTREPVAKDVDSPKPGLQLLDLRSGGGGDDSAV